jgi:ribonuclease VapC
MIVVDTSAIVAAMIQEAGYTRIIDAIARADGCAISAVSFVEATMVLSRTLRDPQADLNAYLRETAISISPLDSDQARLAQDAFLTYGKGRHPARLNIGDCFSYAAAKALNAPLLYVGGDFAKTDIRAA